MFHAVGEYKIIFTFKMPDGTLSAGVCDHPKGLPEVFEIVRRLGGTELIIEDKTIYVNVH
jgi:hypothetical protein